MKNNKPYAPSHNMRYRAGFELRADPDTIKKSLPRLLNILDKLAQQPMPKSIN